MVVVHVIAVDGLIVEVYAVLCAVFGAFLNALGDVLLALLDGFALRDPALNTAEKHIAVEVARKVDHFLHKADRALALGLIGI